MVGAVRLSRSVAQFCATSWIGVWRISSRLSRGPHKKLAR
jgi:hypothetical protein